MSHMDTTWKVIGLGVLLSFVESASTRLCFLPSQNSMTFGSIKPLSWVATQTLPALCCHFLAVNNHPTLPQDALSHHVPLVAAEPVLKKQMYSWSRSFGNTGRNKGSVAGLEEYQMRSPRNTAAWL